MGSGAAKAARDPNVSKYSSYEDDDDEEGYAGFVHRSNAENSTVGADQEGIDEVGSDTEELAQWGTGWMDINEQRLFHLDEPEVEELAADAARRCLPARADARDYSKEEQRRVDALALSLRELQRARVQAIPEHIDPEWWEGGKNMLVPASSPRRNPLPALLYQKLYIHDNRVVEVEDDEPPIEATEEVEDEDADKSEDEKEDASVKEGEEEASQAAKREEEEDDEETLEERARELLIARAAAYNSNPKLQGFAKWLHQKSWRHLQCDAKRSERRAAERMKLERQRHKPLHIKADEVNWYRSPEIVPTSDGSKKPRMWCWRGDFVNEVRLIAEAYGMSLPVIELWKAQRAYSRDPAVASHFRHHVEVTDLAHERYLWNSAFVQTLGVLRAKWKITEVDDDVRRLPKEVESSTGRSFPEPTQGGLPLRRPPKYFKPAPETVKHALACRKLLEATGELEKGEPPIPLVPLVLPQRVDYNVQPTRWISEEYFLREHGEAMARQLVESRQVLIRKNPNAKCMKEWQFRVKSDDRDEGWVHFQPDMEKLLATRRPSTASVSSGPMSASPGTGVRRRGSLAASGKLQIGGASRGL